MTLSMYQASIPAFTLALTNLSLILTKAAAFAEAKKIPSSALLGARLYPDMFPLSRQVQIATDAVKGGAARLAGVEVPSYPDTETSLDELHARVEKTLAFLRSFTPAQIDGSETKPIALKAGPNDLTFNGQDYLTKFVLPNLYFHVSIAYGILRHIGLDIGKMDYLGTIQ